MWSAHVVVVFWLASAIELDDQSQAGLSLLQLNAVAKSSRVQGPWQPDHPNNMRYLQCREEPFGKIEQMAKSDFKLCHCWGDTHCSHVFFDEWIQDQIEQGFHYQYSNLGASTMAKACDGSWEIQIWQCTCNAYGCAQGVAVKAHGVLVEVVADHDNDFAPKCYVGGELQEPGAEASLPNGFSYKCPDGQKSSLCINLDDQFSTTVSKFDWHSYWDHNLFVKSNVCTQGAGTICGEESAKDSTKDPSPYGKYIEIEPLKDDEVMFSEAAVTWVKTQPNCDVGQTAPPKGEIPDPKALCDAQSTARWATVQGLCSPLQDAHPGFHQDCLIDMCNNFVPDEEEEIEIIAGSDEPTIACLEDPCGMNPCTDDVVKLDFGTVSQNNLGGIGPDSGEPELRYKRVATVGDKVVDLVVKALGEYKSPKPETNGMDGEFGRISVGPDHEIEMEFSFVDQDGDSVQLPKLAFSFVDLDAGKKLTKAESVTVCGVDNMAVNPATSLIARKVGDCFIATAGEHGTGKDNPKDPNDMSPLQMERSAAFLLKERASFRVVLKLGPGSGESGRAFQFIGEPTVACPKIEKSR